MELEVLEKKENKLLDRYEVYFIVRYPAAPTPSRIDVKKKLAALLDSSEDLIVIHYLKPRAGKHECTGRAHIYADRKRLEEIEPKYLIERDLRKVKAEKEVAK
ncbi:MAG: 30S ribosomal protein S24e [Candidatus Asgardarchaeum sp.]